MNTQAVFDRANQVAALARWIAATVRRVRLGTVVATAVLALGVLAVADWTSEGVAVAIVVGLFGIAGVVALTLFAHHLDHAADLPRLIREDLPTITGKTADSISRAATTPRGATGVRRVWPILKGLWRLRQDLQALAEEDLKPAQSLIRTFNPIRLIPMVVGLVSTPVMFVMGVLLLVAAALI